MNSFAGNSLKGARKAPSRFLNQSFPSVVELKKMCSVTITHKDYPLSDRVEHNIPIYRLPRYPPLEGMSDYQDEWYYALVNGPGVFVLKKCYYDSDVIDKTSKIFDKIIKAEAATTKGDHFSGAGKNTRIWNSFSKHCIHDSASFAAYYTNIYIHYAMEAYLGPGYRITAQANNVHPGGAAQEAHRDYHLGFQTRQASARFPKGIHATSSFLTLQGAVAHSDMPLDSGPTRFLPCSQLLENGYVCYQMPEFQEYFNKNYVALPLEKGDAVFFNPAIFHAAGENKTSRFERRANLLQISSAFGKPMEYIDTLPLIEKCYGQLQQLVKTGQSESAKRLVAVIAEGYPFPTNLDKAAPAPSKMAPFSEQEIVWNSLLEGWNVNKLMTELKQMRTNLEAL